MQAWTDSQSTGAETAPTILSMRKATTPAQYRAKFFGRVKAARALSGKTPRELADLLGVPKDTYHRYETRVLIPHHLLQQFCTLCGVEIEWLITGSRRAQHRLEDNESVQHMTRAVA